MRLANKFIAFGLAAILKSEAIFACPPPFLPAGWKPPTWNQIIATEFKQAQTVAVIDITAANITRTSMDHALAEFVNKGNFRTIKVYKGTIEALSNPFELKRTNIDCDRRPMLGETGTTIVFINNYGDISFAVYKGESYQSTINELEEIAR
jgi:hypothetical protein